jgi:hypothetical protein
MTLVIVANKFYLARSRALSRSLNNNTQTQHPKSTLNNKAQTQHPLHAQQRTPQRPPRAHAFLSVITVGTI